MAASGAKTQAGERRGDHVYGANDCQHRRGLRQPGWGSDRLAALSFPATAGLGVIAMVALFFPPKGSAENVRRCVKSWLC